MKEFLMDMAMKGLLTPAGGAFLVGIIAFLIPNEKLQKIGFALGRSLTRMGRMSVIGPIYELVETFFENSFRVLIEAFLDGLDSDDSVTAGVPPQPSSSPATSASPTAPPPATIGTPPV